MFSVTDDAKLRRSAVPTSPTTAGPGGDPDPEHRPARMRGERPPRGHDRARGPRGPHRVVGLVAGGIEDGHDAVAREVLDGAARAASMTGTTAAQ